MKKFLFFTSLFMLAFVCAVKGENIMSKNKNTSVRLIRNATLRIEYAGKSILIDPMLCEKGELPSFLGLNTNPRVHLTMPIDEIINNIDFVLASHTHEDHFDKTASELLNKNIKLLVQPTDVEYFRNKYHFTNVHPIVDSIQIDGITIIRTTGSHGKGKAAPILGSVSGFILKSINMPTIYIVSDCIWTDQIKSYIQKYRPDYIIINCGGAILPTEFSDIKNAQLSEKELRTMISEGSIIMNECDVVDMIKNAPSKSKFIAVHMEALDHCQTTRSILRNEANHSNISPEKLIIPNDGDVIILK